MRRPARRFSVFLAMVLAVGLAMAPGLAFARAGGISSFGSRGMRSYSAPPMTNTSPYTAAPLQRSLTPPPSYAPSQGSRAFGGGGSFGRSSFTSGLMGGLLGAGIGGLLFGGGMFHGGMGFGGFFGLLLQLFLLVMLGRFLWRMFTTRQVAGRQPAMAGAARMPAPGPFQRTIQANNGGGQVARPIQISQADFQAFGQLLQSIQAAWSAHDLNALRNLASPEMTSYFSEQLSEQTSRGVRNIVTDVRLDQGDLSEAWAEPGREYATVAMRFSMVDVTRDPAGRVVDGHPGERISATEVWTFLRAPGGRWILSAIQQAR